MPPSLIHSLPEELLLSIFAFLESPPPSRLRSRQEPTLHLTEDEGSRNYKNISCVSKLWRRVVLPLLFKYSHLSLDIAPRAEWADCSVCGDNRDATSQDLRDGINVLHAKLFRDALEPPGTTRTAEISDSSYTSLQWAGRFHHTLDDYIQFLVDNDLTMSVQSFVLSTGRTLPRGRFRFPHRLAANEDHRFRASAELWKHTFSIIDPTRVVIVARPADLACLTNCAIDLFGDWAFGDMEYHILELSRRGVQSAKRLETSATSSALSWAPEEYPGIAASSVLNLRPWTDLGLNEGSFLKAYGTCEYLERDPPSLICSITDCLASNRRAFMPSSQDALDLGALRSFTYTAILPFAHHLDFRGLLPYIDELDVKLAPDPESNILNDEMRVSKGELEDCWEEFFAGYRFITRPFRTLDIRPDGTPRLKRFICRDVTTPALQVELDEEFVGLCLPVWAEMKPGVFERLQQAPPTNRLEDA